MGKVVDPVIVEVVRNLLLSIADETNTVIIKSMMTGFNPLTIKENGTFDILITRIRNNVVIMYPGMLLNKNSEIRYSSVPTSFTLGSNRCNTLFAG